MTKHILGQAIFQAIVLFVFIFGGDRLIPESGVWGYASPGIGYDRNTTLYHPNPAQRNYSPDMV